MCIFRYICILYIALPRRQRPRRVRGEWNGEAHVFLLAHELMHTYMSISVCIYKSLTHEVNSPVEFVESGMARHTCYSLVHELLAALHELNGVPMEFVESGMASHVPT